MKYLPIIAGGLLGLLFVFAAAAFFFHWGPQELPKEPAALGFMTAFGPTGYFTFIKIFELLGGVLVAIPRTRNLGLLVLGPIIVNIVAFSVFVMKGEGLTNPMLIFICLLAVYLLWVERKAWAALVTR
jgi:putative oxidoreductase